MQPNLPEKTQEEKEAESALEDEQFTNLLCRQDSLRKTTERRKTKIELKVEREEQAKEEAKMQVTLEEYEKQRRMTKKETEDMQELEVAIENKVQAISIGVVGVGN